MGTLTPGRSTRPSRCSNRATYASLDHDGFRLSRGICFLPVLRRAGEARLALSRQASGPVPTSLDRRFPAGRERPPQVRTHPRAPSVPCRSSEQLRRILPRRRRRFRGRTVPPTSSVSALPPALAYGKAAPPATAHQASPGRVGAVRLPLPSEDQRLRHSSDRVDGPSVFRVGIVAFPLKGRDKGLTEAFSYFLAV
jgi:hypothetical protein